MSPLARSEVNSQNLPSVNWENHQHHETSLLVPVAPTHSLANKADAGGHRLSRLRRLGYSGDEAESELVLLDGERYKAGGQQGPDSDQALEHTILLSQE